MDTQEIYCENKKLIIRKADGVASRGLPIPASDLMQMMKSTAEAEVTIDVKDVADAIAEISAAMKLITAAGGLVVNKGGEVLLIYRRGHWDLPKGKTESGETVEQSAMREVEEETGLQNLMIEKPLRLSRHIYEERGRTILKETHWYLMRYEGGGHLTPQTEEDIREALWVRPKDLSAYYAEMFAMIRDLIQESDVIKP